MTDKKYIIALDQGTTSSRAVLLDHNANVVEIAQREFTQIYPRAGWVEHNPMEIWATQSSTLNEVVAKAGITSDEIAAIGITNQRETTIVWEKATGTPIYNAIVWQCRRTADITDKLKADGHGRVYPQHHGFSGGSVFLRYKSEMDFRQCRRRTRKSGTWRASIWYRGYLACMEINSRSCSRNGLHQRIPYYVI